MEGIEQYSVPGCCWVGKHAADVFFVQLKLDSHYFSFSLSLSPLLRDKLFHNSLLTPS